MAAASAAAATKACAELREAVLFFVSISSIGILGAQRQILFFKFLTFHLNLSAVRFGSQSSSERHENGEARRHFSFHVFFFFFFSLDTIAEEIASPTSGRPPYLPPSPYLSLPLSLSLSPSLCPLGLWDFPEISLCWVKTYWIAPFAPPLRKASLLHPSAKSWTGSSQT